jgi:hypothetical protein
MRTVKSPTTLGTKRGQPVKIHAAASVPDERLPQAWPAVAGLRADVVPNAPVARKLTPSIVEEAYEP